MMIHKIKQFLELIKFEHTVFALPFAYLGMLLAFKEWPGFVTFAWVTLAMVGARTAAMALNRIVDVKIDAKNPRTQRRPTVTGEIPVAKAWILVAGALAVFFFSAWMLNPLCLALSPVALVLLSTYHYAKRFTPYCHFLLGLTLAVAPIGGWIAVTGAFSWTAVLLSLAVLFWVAGFDIIYSLQDVDFDRAEGLHSVPVRFGERAALRATGYCHFGAVFFLSFFGLMQGLGLLYWVGVCVTAALLKVEHWLVAEGDLKHINVAFFTINGWIGILLLIFSFLDIYR